MDRRADRTATPRYAFATVVLAAVALSACGLPRDPHGTLDRVRGGTLRAGLIEHPPWASSEAGEPSGVEVELLEGLAEDLDAEVRWTTGTESELIDALELGELDAVVGGLTADAPWSSKAAFTAPYLETRVVVGVPLGDPTAIDLEGMEVAVERGSPAAGLLRAAGAVPVEVDDLTAAGGAAAVDEWLLDDLGLRASDENLDEREHVLALPLGENAWLVEVEEFLHAQDRMAARLLQEAGAA
jgi:polar amino acid transport system substrate-binding protein